MFLRFTVPQRDTQSGVPAGVFVAAYLLLDGDGLSTDDHAAIREPLDWFREHLRVPPCLKTDAHPRAICWFRSSAIDHVRHAWDLARLLRAHDRLVRLHKTEEPGRIVYEDAYQVAAVPSRREVATVVSKAWA